VGPPAHCVAALVLLSDALSGLVRGPAKRPGAFATDRVLLARCLVALREHDVAARAMCHTLGRRAELLALASRRGLLLGVAQRAELVQALLVPEGGPVGVGVGAGIKQAEHALQSFIRAVDPSVGAPKKKSLSAIAAGDPRFRTCDALEAGELLWDCVLAGLAIGCFAKRETMASSDPERCALAALVQSALHESPLRRGETVSDWAPAVAWFDDAAGRGAGPGAAPARSVADYCDSVLVRLMAVRDDAGALEGVDAEALWPAVYAAARADASWQWDGEGMSSPISQLADLDLDAAGSTQGRQRTFMKLQNLLPKSPLFVDLDGSAREAGATSPRALWNVSCLFGCLARGLAREASQDSAMLTKFEKRILDVVRADSQAQAARIAVVVAVVPLGTLLRERGQSCLHAQQVLYGMTTGAASAMGLAGGWLQQQAANTAARQRALLGQRDLACASLKGFRDLVAAGGVLKQDDDSCLHALDKVMLAASPQSQALTLSHASLAFEAVALLAALLAAGLTGGGVPPDIVKVPPDLDEFPPPFAHPASAATAPAAEPVAATVVTATTSTTALASNEDEDFFESEAVLAALAQAEQEAQAQRAEAQRLDLLRAVKVSWAKHKIAVSGAHAQLRRPSLEAVRLFLTHTLELLKVWFRADPAPPGSAPPDHAEEHARSKIAPRLAVVATSALGWACALSHVLTVGGQPRERTWLLQALDVRAWQAPAQRRTAGRAVPVHAAAAALDGMLAAGVADVPALSRELLRPLLVAWLAAAMDRSARAPPFACGAFFDATRRLGDLGVLLEATAGNTSLECRLAQRLVTRSSQLLAESGGGAGGAPAALAQEDAFVQARIAALGKELGAAWKREDGTGRLGALCRSVNDLLLPAAAEATAALPSDADAAFAAQCWAKLLEGGCPAGLLQVPGQARANNALDALHAAHLNRDASAPALLAILASARRDDLLLAFADRHRALRSDSALARAMRAALTRDSLARVTTRLSHIAGAEPALRNALVPTD
jgi:hypothetical protein